ncbi:MAG: hypothetical protein UX13_C0003G0024, partial [Candidatus Woesebacteria bacterium GW2011_GWB1_45_5]
IMGERYQFHIMIQKAGLAGEWKLFSIHAQWCWGPHTIRNANRLIQTIKNSNLDHWDFEPIGDYFKAILELNKGMDGKNYFFRVHLDEPYNTFNGDSNHGWVVVRIQTTEGKAPEIQTRFYTVEGKPETNEMLWVNALEDLKTASVKEKNAIKAMIAPEFNNTTDDLQEIFNRLVEAKKTAEAAKPPAPA